MPVVSVLLPCFEAEATLGDALESLWAQSFADFEVIAVDDGSRDGTLALLEAAARGEPRLRVVRAPHSGIVSALQRAVAGASAPLLARMDADDVAHPDRLRLQVAHFEARPELAVSSCRVRLFPREALRDGYRRYEAWVNGVMSHDDIRRNLFVESPIPHPSVVVRRDALLAVGGYREPGWPEDYDLWMRLVHAGYRFDKLPDTLLDWRDAPDRASRTQSVYAPERFADAKEHYLKRHYLDEARPLAIWGAGPIGKSWAKRLRPRHLIELDPRKVGQRIHGAEVVSSEDLDAIAGAYVVVAVGALSRTRDAADPYRPARDEIRERLEAFGLTELEDFVCVA